MAETDGIDIFEGLSDDELFDGFGEGAPVKEEPAIVEEPQEEETEEEVTEETEETEEPTEEVKEEPAVEEKTEDQSFSLKHLGETKDYSRDETIALAQKGLDYDRIRSERDALKAERVTLQEHEDFLKELAELSNLSIDDLMVNVKANLVLQDEQKKGNKDITLEQAKYRVQTEQRIKKAEAPKKSAREEDFERFSRNYPDVTEIPKEVWAEYGDGSGKELSVLYSQFLAKQEIQKSQDELAKIQERLNVLEQNEKNKKRSTGSRRSNGAPTVDKDLDGWGEY